MAAKDPFQVLRERAADSIPGLGAWAHIIGIQNIKRVMQAAHRRTDDGHRAMARAAGMEDIVAKAPEAGDDMGDVIITGDITTTSPTAPMPTQEQGGIGKAGLALAGLLLGGALGAGAMYLANRPATPAQPAPAAAGEQKPQEWEVNIWVTKEGKVVREIRPVTPTPNPP